MSLDLVFEIKKLYLVLLKIKPKNIYVHLEKKTHRSLSGGYEEK